MFSFTSNFHRICLHLFANLYFHRIYVHGLARYLRHECHKNIYEVRFSNIYILSHIIYYIPPLTIIFALAIKVVVCRMSDRILVAYLQYIKVISKIKYEVFSLDFIIAD